MNNRSNAKKSFSKTYVVSKGRKITVDLEEKYSRRNPQCRLEIEVSVNDRGTTKRNNIKTVKTKKVSNANPIIRNKYKVKSTLNKISYALILEAFYNILHKKISVGQIKTILDFINNSINIELNENDGTILMSLFELTGAKRGVKEILLKDKSVEYGLNEEEFNDSLSKLLELKCIRRNDGLIEFLEEITIKKG